MQKIDLDLNRPLMQKDFEKILTQEAVNYIVTSCYGRWLDALWG